VCPRYIKQKSKIRGGSRIRFRVFVLDVLRSPESRVRSTTEYVVNQPFGLLHPILVFQNNHSPVQKWCSVRVPPLHRLGFVSVCSCWTSYGVQSPEYGVLPSMLYVVVLRIYSVDSQGQIEPIFHVLAKKKKHAPSGVRPVQVVQVQFIAQSTDYNRT
jgi:hypothetical protein